MNTRFLLPVAALFAALAALMAMGWSLIGSAVTTGAGGAGRLVLLRRTASVWLALVSVGLAVSTLSA